MSNKIIKYFFIETSAILEHAENKLKEKYGLGDIRSKVKEFFNNIAKNYGISTLYVKKEAISQVEKLASKKYLLNKFKISDITVINKISSNLSNIIANIFHSFKMVEELFDKNEREVLPYYNEIRNWYRDLEFSDQYMKIITHKLRHKRTALELSDQKILAEAVCILNKNLKNLKEILEFATKDKGFVVLDEFIRKNFNIIVLSLL